MIFTDCAAVKLPGKGEKTGVAAGFSIVNSPNATRLFLYPGAIAIALIVSVDVTLSGAEYKAEVAVGVAPLVV